MSNRSTGDSCGTFVTETHTKFFFKLMAKWSLTDIPNKLKEEIPPKAQTNRYELILFKSYLSSKERNDARTFIRSINTDVLTFYQIWTLTYKSIHTPLIMGEFFNDCHLNNFFKKKEFKFKDIHSKLLFLNSA